MISIKQLQEDIKLNKEHEKKKLHVSNKILETRLKYLALLKEHYEGHLLDLGLQSYKSKIECTTIKCEFMTHQLRETKLNQIWQRLSEEEAVLDQKISQIESRLDQFRRLDPVLLAEYRELNDELECQEMLIQISELNGES